MSGKQAHNTRGWAPRWKPRRSGMADMKHEVEKRGALVARSPWGSPQDTLEGNTRDSRRQTRVNHSCV
jgi:hypothetical protein